MLVQPTKRLFTAEEYHLALGVDDIL